MTDQSVLVVTRLADPTSDVIIAELGRRGVPVVRLDPADFLAGGVELIAGFGPYGASGVLATPSRRVDLGSIRSVYYRRPSAYEPPAGMDDQDARFAVAQARQGLGGVLAGLDCRFVNHPWHIMRHDHKPMQLKAATAAGFHVPPTLVTNSLDAARRFAIEHGPVVYKPLAATPFRGQDGHAVSLWVDLVDPDELDERVALTAHQFQTATPNKVADVRITVIGDECFAVRIDSPHVDFRRDYSQVNYTVFDTPAPIVDACHTYLSEFGLLFGAFDLGLRPDGGLDFYECNSAGQWHWLEAETGLPMTNALANLLEMTS